MAEYIEREAVIELITSRYENPEICTAEVNSIPAADVTLVVRCRECIHRNGAPGQPNIICRQMKDDDFCSYGERSTD